VSAGDGAAEARPAGRSGRRPRPRAQRSLTTRDKLLAAAAALFAERGYRVVTLDDIGGAVGISGPAVYRHFKNKESLLGELLVDVSERLLNNARDRAGAAMGPVEALAALVDFHAEFAVENPALITVQSRELSSLAPADQHRVRTLQRSYVEFWADAIVRTGRLERREEAIAAAHAIFGLLNSTPFSGRLNALELRALLHSMALDGLGPNHPGPVTGPIPSGPVAGPATGPVAGPAEDVSARRHDDNQLVRLVEHGAVAEIVLDRPEALNALSSAMAVQLAGLCTELGERPAVRVVVVSSVSERAFCVGADLKERARFDDAEMAAQRPLVRAVFDAVRGLEVPVIAAVAGYALGGGFELALSCDLIVADETAQVALPETAVGLVPGGGGTQLLVRRAGPGVAADLIFTARRVPANEALVLGLVDRVVPPGAARATALEVARVIAGNSPVAVRAAKRAVRLGAGVDLASGLDIEDAAWRTAAASPDRTEGIRAFVEKRLPDWSSPPRPPGLPAPGPTSTGRREPRRGNSHAL
jgi:enoyl-CoA hydratase/carnithine racemase/AcrR family transcriptional regulator